MTKNTGSVKFLFWRDVWTSSFEVSLLILLGTNSEIATRNWAIESILSNTSLGFWPRGVELIFAGSHMFADKIVKLYPSPCLTFPQV